jgi:hypothetical protein
MEEAKNESFITPSEVKVEKSECNSTAKARVLINVDEEEEREVSSNFKLGFSDKNQS